MAYELDGTDNQEPINGVAVINPNLDAMMATWAEDEDIVCIHPGGPRLVGYDAVRAGWEQLFSGDTKLSFRLVADQDTGPVAGPTLTAVVAQTSQPAVARRPRAFVRVAVCCAGRSGVAITLITPAEILKLRDVEKHASTHIEPATLDDFVEPGDSATA